MSFSSLFSFRSSPPAPAVRPASRRAQALRPAAPLLAAVAALALIQAAALLRPSQARAWCDCGSISSIVNAAARRVIDGIAAPLQSAIKAAAGYQTQYLHRDLAALQEAVVAGAESLAAAMQAADRSQARRAAEKTWDETAQSPVICGADEMGQGLQRSWRGSEEALTAVMDKARERRGRFRRPADFLDEAARAPSPKLASARFGLLSSGLTLTWAEFEEAQRLLEQLTDPLPPAEPSEALLRTPAGRVYAALKNDYEARQELYQGVLAKRLADRAPSVEGLAPWAADRWREMGGEGPPPGLVEGRLSETALLRLMTGQRLASANWHEEILPRLTEAGLLRELAAMEAVRLELDRRRNEHLENLTLMAALSGLSELEAGRGEALRLQRRRATGAAAE